MLQLTDMESDVEALFASCLRWLTLLLLLSEDTAAAEADAEQRGTGDCTHGSTHDDEWRRAKEEGKRK